jgi:trimeric autotransporter adhesin
MAKHSFLQLAAAFFFVGFSNLHPIIAQTAITKYGTNALAANTTGDYNSAFGYYALRYNTYGSQNTAIGANALFKNTGSDNTAIGYLTLFYNTIGTNNTATGSQALFRNTSGFHNTATGSQALFRNTTGIYNTAFGSKALSYNTYGYYNTAIGAEALFHNTTGAINTATGMQALFNNTTGKYNTANGYTALLKNTIGDYNTATGYKALYYNTLGGYNTAIGYLALSYNTTGYYNTAIGLAAGPSYSFPNLFNTTALGSEATTTASNQVRIGNSSVTSIGGYASWTKLSDSRYKKNVKEYVPGLEFITQLRPVTYTVDVEGLDKALNKDMPALDDNESQGARPEPSAEEIASKAASAQVIHTGFVAQEVEATAKKLGYVFSGIDAPKNEKDFYGLRYAEFVVPLVKAVQELNKKDEEITKRTDELLKKTEEINQLKKELTELRQMVLELKNAVTNSSSNLSSAYLEQSTPNPTSGIALIRYYIPQNTSATHLVFTDIKGAIIKSITLNNKGAGQLSVNTAAWTVGTYTYTLYINGTQADSKKLVIAR